MNKLKMKSGYMVLIIAVLFTFSCHNTKNVNNINKKVAEEENPDLSENYKLIVSFYSPGNGIDHKMKKEYSTFLANNYPKIVYEKIKWGKEGEIDFCFQLTELNDNQKEQFVKETNELLSNSSKIHINENTPCSHKKSP